MGEPWISRGKIKTIRGKFLVLTLLLTVVPMFALSFLFYRIAAQSLGNKAEEHAYQSRLMSANFLNGTITDLNDLTNAILGNPEVQSILQQSSSDDYEFLRNVERVNKIIRAQTQTKPYIISTLIYAANGVPGRSFFQGNDSIRFGGLPTLGEANDYFERLRKDNQLMWHNGSPFVRADYSLPDEHLYVGKLLRRTEGNYEELGFLMLEIEKSSFFHGISFLKPDSKSQFWILDSVGNPIYRIPENDEADLTALRQIAAEAKVRPDRAKEWLDWRGERSMVSYAPLVLNGWTLLHRVESSALFEDANRIGRLTIQIFLVVLLAGWILAYRMSDTIRRPLRKLRGMMTLTGAASTPAVHFDTRDEVGQIGDRLQRMMRENQRLNDQVYEAMLSWKEAEFRALQAQINPHFLYNTLESLNGLALANGQREMSDMIGALGKFFRIALSQGSEVIRIGEEAEHVNAYVRVQQFRFRDKFEWISEVDEEILSGYVPKLLLQPLVENAIYHGLKKRKGVAYLMLTGSREDHLVKFSVSDDGNGIEPERLEQIIHALEDAEGSVGDGEETDDRNAIGFGLKNVHARLRYYGPQYGLQIASEPGLYTTVTLTVPWWANRPEGGRKHAPIIDRG
ncbi:sensor histidine kinase [Cohnella herbarum]|uniref:Sensor histidine kinase n=1 Tax=Cohnella herbarum TaxID=2728023 RepID=A0A7Z2ZPX9_9BACL|nr:sensor histidine kinase [Cohnella herbarum]QJD87803.1 sensor histidine kinase [Cohnella herbarum]